MKKTLTTLALLTVGTYGLLGQGAINFNNRATSLNPTAVVAPIYGPEANPLTEKHGNATTNGGAQVYSGVLLTGTGFTAQLWAAPVALGAGALSPLSTTTMRPAGVFAGFVTPPAVAPIVAGAADGSQVIFALRVWDNRNNTVTLWQQVLADMTILRGDSGNFTTGVAVSPTTPPNLVGLTSFNLFTPIPEPSLIALGALGLGALLLRRRKA